MTKNQAPSAIREASRLVAQGQRLLEKAIANDAKNLLQRHPLVDSYTQAMGSATVNVNIGGFSFELSLEQGCDQIRRHMIWEELNESTRSDLNKLGRDLRTLQKIHDAWSDLFTGSLAGEPLHIDKNLTVTTEW